MSAMMSDPLDDSDETDIQEEIAKRAMATAEAIVGKLDREANRRVGMRRTLEERWLDDLRQYHGVYPSDTLGRSKDTGEQARVRSSVFVNVTRAKTEALAARMFDLLFPTDDRNWAIDPTPVPQLTREARSLSDEMMRLWEQEQAAMEEAEGQGEDADPEAMAEMQAAKEARKALERRARQINADIQQARRRCDMMQDEIEDQLTECNSQAAFRDMIEQGCKIGTGVIKGPTTEEGIERWKEADQGGWAKQRIADETGKAIRRPGVQWVDAWHFFPPPEARSLSPSDDVFQRHLLSKSDLRRLAKAAGFNRDAIRDLIKQGPRKDVLQFLMDLRAITSSTQIVDQETYIVWEWHGALESQELVDMAIALGEPRLAALVMKDGEVDPLAEMRVVVWFCDGVILKAGPALMDDGSQIYSVFSPIRDEGTLFGYGLPYILKDPQRALNSAWRMMMDNGAVSAGPQIIVNRDLVTPADGFWEIRPNKIWYRKMDAIGDGPAFQMEEVKINQAELAGIIDLAMRFIDDESQVPKLAQGEQGAQPTNTVGGISILMNASNVGFRRIVRNFDDDVTVPIISRFYDWNMQFGEDAQMKGDYKVRARGSSVLLVREMQAANIMALMMNFSQHPDYGPMLKKPELMRRLLQTLMMPPDQNMKSEEEIQREAALLAEDPAAAMAAEEMEFRKMELQAKVEIANMESSTRLQVAETNLNAAMYQAAEKLNLTMDQIEANARERRADRESKERIAAIELAKTDEIGPSGGGLF